MNKKQLSSLYDICSYTRAAGSEGERAMIAKHIEPIANYTDGYGNLYVMIGQPSVIYSSHTDTVHRDTDPFQQTVYIDDTESRLFKGEDKMCLGADCGTGVWIMLQMIKAKVPGLYIFHRAEEIGGLGSGWIADNPQASTDSEHEHWLQHYAQCIAFDRYGTKSIITHQGMERTCSNEYADALSAVLGMGHGPDDGGSFTDSKNYCHLIPECTNLSVGYKHQHSNNEYQDLDYLLELTDRLCTVGHEIDKLAPVRDPSKQELLDYESYSTFGRRNNYSYFGTSKISGLTNYDYDHSYSDNPLHDAIQTYPEAVAEMLREAGYQMDDDELARAIEERWVWADDFRRYG